MDEQAISSCLGITEKQYRLLVSDRDSKQTLRSMLTKFCTQGFWRKITIEFVFGKFCFNLFKII